MSSSSRFSSSGLWPFVVMSALLLGLGWRQEHVRRTEKQAQEARAEELRSELTHLAAKVDRLDARLLQGLTMVGTSLDRRAARDHVDERAPATAAPDAHPKHEAPAESPPSDPALMTVAQQTLQKALANGRWTKDDADRFRAQLAELAADDQDLLRSQLAVAFNAGKLDYAGHEMPF